MTIAVAAAAAAAAILWIDGGKKYFPQMFAAGIRAWVLLMLPPRESKQTIHNNRYTSEGDVN